MARRHGGMKASGNRLELIIFYVVALSWFTSTFLWHFGSEASKLPQAQNFGWFFKYLTFCGFTFQTLSLLISLLAHLVPQVAAVNRAADDFSCSAFAIANVITVMHWVLYFTTSVPVEGGAQAKLETTVKRSLNVREASPLWLNLTVHLANAAVAWIDVHVSKRTFRTWSFQQSLIFCLMYTIWIQVCAAKNNMYPYPFLNKLPQPGGILGTIAVGFILACTFYKLGSSLPTVQENRRIEAKLKIQ